MKPTDAKMAKPTGPRGRFIGLEATGKELYRVVLFDTVGGVIVNRTILSEGSGRETGGKQVTGNALAAAWMELSIQATRRIKDAATSLWKDAP